MRPCDQKTLLQETAPRNTARRCSWSTTTCCARTTRTFKKHLPRVQAYYAVKANSDPAIVQDVLRSRRQLRRRLHGRVPCRAREHQAPAGQASGRTSSGTRSSTPIRSRRSRRSSELDPVQAAGDVRQPRGDASRSQATRRTPGLVLRMRVPNTGAMVELSSKFGALPGEAVDLIAFATTRA